MNLFTVVNRHILTETDYIKKQSAPFVVISIYRSGENVGCEKPVIPANKFCSAILYLEFDDEVAETPHSINDQHAKEVLAFAEKYHHIKQWIVSCEAGMSRSVAVARALSEIMNERNPDSFIVSTYNLEFYNRFVYKKIMNGYRQEVTE